MPRTRAVLFDIGGTLFTYDMSKTNRDTRNEKVAAAFGLELVTVASAFDDGMARASAEFFARSYYLHKELFSAATRYAFEALGVDPARGAELLAPPPPAPGQQPPARRITPRADAEQTLLGIRDRGLHIGAVSNSDCDQFAWMIDGLGFRHHFDSLLCSEEVESCKPDAKIFIEALRRAGCDPDEALFVGDTPDHDIVGAERVGMRTALIIEEGGPGFERGQAKPDQVVIRELTEILDLL